MEAIRQGRNKQQEQKKPITVRTVQATDYLFRGFFVLGIYMPKNYRFLYVIYSLVVNILVTICLPLAFTMSYMHMNAAQLQLGNLLTSVQVAINVVGCSVKIIIMAFLLKTLKSADSVFEKLDARCVTPKEVDHLNGIVQWGRRLVGLFAISYWSYATSTFLGSVLMGRLPYSIYNPFFNWRESQLFFVTQSLIEFGLMAVACFQQVVDDSYAVIYVCIIRTHVQILIERIQKLASEDDSNWTKNTEELKMCIKDHKNLLELFNIIYPVMSITIFIQFMITAAILGTTLINILLFATDFSSRIASCFYILAVVVEIFPLCYYSQCLMDDSDRLSQVLFHSNWIGQDATFRKMLIFFMQRSQKRMEFTAGKIFPITLNSFLGIAKFSFSLYTFIKGMGIKEKLELN